MATINSVNNSLTGATGTGSFVGSSGPTLTGTLDWSGASFFRLPVSATPTVNVTGQMALDTTVTGYPGLLKYYNGTQEMAVLGMSSGDFTATNNYVITYDSANSKLKLAAQSGGGGSGIIVQYVIATSSANDSTSSTTLVDTSLSASITPTSGSNNILVMCSFYGSITTTSGTPNILYFYSAIARSAPSSATLVKHPSGRVLDAGAATAGSYKNVKLGIIESASTTSLHTYKLQQSVDSSGVSTTVNGSVYPAIMILMEVTP